MPKALRAVVVVVVEAVPEAMKHLEIMEVIVVAVEWEGSSLIAVVVGDDDSEMRLSILDTTQTGNTTPLHGPDGTRTYDSNDFTNNDTMTDTT
ncbi:hypothetical protein MMC17_002783 [Xylographa soralifera]|nr:hypothetical protein [Xylographa soralifera]